MLLSQKQIAKLIAINRNREPENFAPHVKSIIVSYYKFVQKNVPPKIRALFSEINDGTKFEMEFEERVLARFFPRIDYRVQEMLVKSQTEIFGRSLATPDFLFTYSVEVFIRTKKIMNVNWIDVKDFFAHSNSYEAEKLPKQAQRNISLFGPGIFVFSLGIERELKQRLEKMFTVFENGKKLKLLRLLSVSGMKIRKNKGSIKSEKSAETF